MGESLDFLRWIPKDAGVFALLTHYPFLACPFEEEELLTASGPNQIPPEVAKQIISKLNQHMPTPLASFGLSTILDLLVSFTFWLPFYGMREYNKGAQALIFFLMLILLSLSGLIFFSRYIKKKEAEVKDDIQGINQTLSRYELILELVAPFTIFPLTIKVRGLSDEETSEQYSKLAFSIKDVSARVNETFDI
eukprot:TRINITY_DN8296_c0_g1_i5.p1 TRINITY_DN8296_c0_g1~~TRINITY_DN8296_c0_g1_i5.p1  ORF type:complete len:193 (+),score=33.33 TRINITY_DN8296_c0_g1_i5:139-717(+)